MTKTKLILISISILITGGLFVSQNTSIASVVSNNYKHYKAKYKNKEDKRNYQKMKDLKKKNKKLFLYWKAICEAHKYDSDSQYHKLSQTIQDMCDQYYSYKGYKKYIYWRNKHDDNNDNSDNEDADVFVCGTDTVQDADGNTYDTVQVGTQCWMASNMNVGTRINGTGNQTDNDVIEKYCYNDDPNICDTDGGLYQWNEAMQYVTAEGTQGICPVGWHISSDADWHSLENYFRDIGETCDPDRDYNDCAGAGTQLKQGGSSGLNFILASYKGLSWGGDRGDNAYIWTSLLVDANNAMGRYMESWHTTVGRYANPKSLGFSVRCLKD